MWVRIIKRLTVAEYIDPVRNKRNIYRVMVTDGADAFTLTIMTKKTMHHLLIQGNIIRFHRGELISGERLLKKTYKFGAKRLPLEMHVLCDLDIKGSIVIFNKNGTELYRDKTTYTWEQQDDRKLAMLQK